MHRIAELIQRQLKLSVFVPLLLLALGTTWFGLFWSVNHFGQLSNGLPFMDMQPWLTAELLFEQIRSYGNEAVEFAREKSTADVVVIEAGCRNYMLDRPIVTLERVRHIPTA